MTAYTTNDYGLRQQDMDYMGQVFAAMHTVEQVVLYGSRASGIFQKGADVDIAIKGRNVTPSDISRIHFLLGHESPTLLWFDVLDYGTLTNDRLKQEIDNNGKVIYTR